MEFKGLEKSKKMDIWLSQRAASDYVFYYYVLNILLYGYYYLASYVCI